MKEPVRVPPAVGLTALLPLVFAETCHFIATFDMARPRELELMGFWWLVMGSLLAVVSVLLYQRTRLGFALMSFVSVVLIIIGYANFLVW